MQAINLKNEDLVKITKLTSQQIEQVTCVECCKYYIAPETASCGHTLCHTCWRERITCPYCTKPITRSSLKLNYPIQKLKEDVQTLGDAFEKLFKIKVAEVLLEVEPETDSTKNVKDWLASSQNHFSAPFSSEKSSQDMAELQKPLNVSSNKIQIHTNNLKSKNPEPEKAVYVSTIPQDDWDKIEPMPDTEVHDKKGKENVIGPMDIEPFYVDDDNQYTARNPRRSSRKRELKPSNENNNNDNKLPVPDQNSKDSSEDADKKSSKAKQNWNNVKRMRKEFSKLNKKNRNKLNVSIEMCKKTQSTTKTFDAFPPTFSVPYDIDENTPNNNLLRKGVSEQQISHVVEEKVEAIPKPDTKDNQMQEMDMKTSRNDQINSTTKNNVIVSQQSNVQIVHSSKEAATEAHCNLTNNAKMPFYKRSSLTPKCTEGNVSKTINHTVESNTNSNDDIEITIKVGNTITNILIRKKNDMQLKINTDREIQTSLGSYEINEKTNTPKCSQAQNIVINVSENNDIDVKHQAISTLREDNLKKIISEKTVSEKKNTDSAETATAQFEITASVEKELSKIMEFGDIEESDKTKTVTVTCEKSSKTNESQKMPVQLSESSKTKTVDNIEKLSSQKELNNPEENDYINDLDIFDSESLKEPQVKYLKNTEPAPSEILQCTVKTKSKTQKVSEKRCRGASDEDVLPNSKKAKCNDDKPANVTTEHLEHNKSKHDQPDSESMNYDDIMGTVFANIDADIRESQNIIKNTYTLDDKNSQNKNLKEHSQVKMTQEVDLPAIVENDTSQLINKCNSQKDSENIFSVCVEKEDEHEVQVSLASANKKMPNLDEFLTPVLCQAVDDVHVVNDDSDDKSVVEETPQKTSFTKVKPKSNGPNRNATPSQRTELSNKKGPSKSSTEGNMNSIVSITDTSIRSDGEETAINIAGRPTETPLTIEKFVHQIQHKSTPYAKKSLNFDSENVDDLTLCATNIEVANTTQEREFMLKAFEKTPTTSVKPPSLKNLALKHKKYVIAGSCLTNDEIVNLQNLCTRNKWTYTNKYSKNLTHLVVGVDEENKAQRTIKYMCALASSKWIISYEWVTKCLQSKDPVNEEQYEVLDSTGHPGPMRSRIANKKLFQGITFFCMEPFSVLDVNTLKEMLTSSGGTVVEEVRAVRVTDKTSAPALLLAEPENTQEDRFIYLAMELAIVPVNHEWVLNCLGSYSLNSIQDLLLCPASLLPKATERWPQELLARDEDE